MKLLEVNLKAIKYLILFHWAKIQKSKAEITEEGDDPELEEKEQETHYKFVRDSGKVTVDKKFRDKYKDDFEKMGSADNSVMGEYMQ